ncbi:hypothetical protein [Nitrosopumilus adriaticus]|uniref:Uncharacterized protein n=1 Tax=Nitrosopumilus adriaticus TaxID=1580092 RepID=A0A0D5C2V4_9ARCH|nr:hypothetical protein [Nitrosopumilus adriaticus]AJW71046.1 hypothetical protein NADRNF5_1360 [Nitrosopumilus adriaticus]
MDNTKFAITIIITIISLVIAQGNFMNEILVHFEISDDLISESSITLNNFGLIQASNVKAFVTLNNTANITLQNCIEGTISSLGENRHLIEFDRMSPNLKCTINSDIANVKIKEATITSENHSAYIYQLSEIQRISTIFLVMILITSGFFVWILYYPVIFLYNILGAKIFYRDIEKPEFSEEIKEFIKDEFAMRTTTIFEAIILKYVYDGKTTKGQLIAKTNMDPMLVSFFLDLLKRKQLIDKDNLLNSEIQKFIDNLKKS